MSLDREEVPKIAHLAMLAVDDSEIERYAAELANILALVDRMNAVDTEGVVPMAHPLDSVQRLRPGCRQRRRPARHFPKGRAGRARRFLPSSEGHRVMR